MADQAADRVTPEQIEARLRVLQDDLSGRAQAAKSRAIPIAIGGAFLLLLLAYLAGKRVGKKKSTVVEIRRI